MKNYEPQSYTPRRVDPLVQNNRPFSDLCDLTDLQRLDGVNVGRLLYFHTTFCFHPGTYCCQNEGKLDAVSYGM